MYETDKTSKRLFYILILALMITVFIAVYIMYTDIQKERRAQLNWINNDLNKPIHIVNIQLKEYTAPIDEARICAEYLKKCIESRMYKDFYLPDGTKKTEKYLQNLFWLTAHNTGSKVERESNNGKGCSDFVFSQGRDKAAVVEFKMASNRHLKHGFTAQVPIYMRTIVQRKL
jgi:hypothetical protein